jgi:hypothetical protein
LLKVWLRVGCGLLASGAVSNTHSLPAQQEQHKLLTQPMHGIAGLTVTYTS